MLNVRRGARLGEIIKDLYFMLQRRKREILEEFRLEKYSNQIFMLKRVLGIIKQKQNLSALWSRGQSNERMEIRRLMSSG